jgi:NAD(P)H-flavin reductase
MAAAIDVAAGSAPLLPRPWRVDAVLRESGDVVTLTLVPVAAGDLCAWRPGQFNMLYVFGVGEVPISIAGGQPERVLHTIREVGPVTRALGALGPGDLVGVRGPFGTPWPVEAARGADVVIVAGGIGLAPLRPVVDAVSRNRDDYGRIALLYGARSPADRLYASNCDDWRARDIQVEVTVDHADLDWPGHVGVVTTLIRRAGFEGRRAAAFLCGPEVMMRFAALELERAGVADERIWVSMERNMQCAVGYCGHCQLGPEFVCVDGPVFPWRRMAGLMSIRGL